MQPKRILVALAGTSADPDIIRLVASIAKPAKAQVIGIHVIEVRWNLPLDAVMEQELDRGEELLESAKKVADQAGLMLETELLQARDAAAAIVDTAVERKCDLIVVAMPYRKRLGRVYVGRTVQNVYVSWSQPPKPKTGQQVYFRRSTDNGATFGPPVQVSSVTGEARFPEPNRRATERAGQDDLRTGVDERSVKPKDPLGMCIHPFLRRHADAESHLLVARPGRTVGDE